jgi:5'-deoxynucleotidase
MTDRESRPAPAPGEQDPDLTESRIASIIDAGGVVRWHTHGRSLSQSVAEHSWGVAAIVLLLKPDASAALLRAAILHDVHEVVLGDIPSPLKRRFRGILGMIEETVQQEFLAEHGLEYPELTADEQRTLKHADKMEAMLFVLRREAPGLSEEKGKKVFANLMAEIEEFKNEG